MYYLQNIVAGLLILIGGLAVFGNWWCFFASYREQKNHSLIPLIGLLACPGCLIATHPSSRAYWWLPLVLDPVNYAFLSLVFLLPYWWWKGRR